LRSIDIERFTPKFLKNWETQPFQKLAGIGSRCLIPTRNLLSHLQNVSFASPTELVGYARPEQALA